MARSVPLRVETMQFGVVDGHLDVALDTGILAVDANSATPIGTSLLVRLIHPKTGNQIPAFYRVVGHRHSADGTIAGLNLKLPSGDAQLQASLQGLVDDILGVASGDLDDDNPGTRGSPNQAAILSEPGYTSAGAEAVIGNAEFSLPVQITLPPFGDFPAAITPYVEDSGLLVLTQTQQPVGQRASVWITHPRDDELIAVNCQIDRTVSSRAGSPSGLVLRFIDVDSALRTTLQDLIDFLRETSVKSPAVVDVAAQERMWSEQIRVFRRSGRLKEALELLRKMVDQHPMDIELHLELAEVALALDNLKLAHWHADFCSKMASERPEPRKVLADISERRRSRAQDKAKQESNKTRQMQAPTNGRRTQLGIASLLVVVSLVGWNVWRYVIPHGPQAEPVNTQIAADLLPTQKIVTFNNRLYIVAADNWKTLAIEQKREVLRKLARRVKLELGVSEIIVAGADAALLARTRDEQVTVYR
ncbi:MAG: hypothetical protein R3C68_04935 [Myxococcota bacterium]